MVFDDKREIDSLIDLFESELGVSKQNAVNFIQNAQVKSLLKSLFSDNPKQEEISLETNSTRNVIPITLKDEIIHMIYDIGDLEYPEGNAQLALLMEQCGYRVEEHFITNTTFVEALENIPRDAIVFTGIAPPDANIPGTQFDAARYVDATFSRVIGPGALFCEICQFKSTMCDKFEKANVPIAPYCLINDLESLKNPNINNRLLSLGFPLFLKLDNGANSEGAGIVPERASLVSAIESMLTKHKSPVMVARFLGGREFTIAVTDKMAYTPIERIFDSCEKFSPPGGTKKQVALSPFDPLTKPIQQIAYQAFLAVSGKSYGRVDIRMDEEGQIYVLEVNNLCSLAADSYFTLSVEASGYSRIQIFADQIEEARIRPPLSKAVSNNS